MLKRGLFLALLCLPIALFTRPGADRAAAPDAAATSAEAGAGEDDFFAEPGTGAAAPSGRAVLYRAPDSHYYADARIDGQPLRLMVDTGASVVALSRSDAAALGIDYDRLEHGGMAQTAGGTVPLRRVTLGSVTVDGVRVDNVEAAVLASDMGTSLLGQSFLSRLRSVNVSGDRMELR